MGSVRDVCTCYLGILLAGSGPELHEGGPCEGSGTEDRRRGLHSGQVGGWHAERRSSRGDAAARLQIDQADVDSSESRRRSLSGAVCSIVSNEWPSLSEYLPGTTLGSQIISKRYLCDQRWKVSVAAGCI